MIQAVAVDASIGSSERIGSGNGGSYATNITGSPLAAASVTAHSNPPAKLSLPMLTLTDGWRFP